jgi:hypothetical protein
LVTGIVLTVYTRTTGNNTHSKFIHARQTSLRLEHYTTA